jgi:uncharacterized protein YjbJ (UPF0337 family)
VGDVSEVVPEDEDRGGDGAMAGAVGDAPNQGGEMDSDRIKGKLKEGEGKLTGDESREADGKMQDSWGKTKDTARDAKDAVGDKVDDLKD